tara:strand:- start:1284 stop:2618 length:1335 start_codon:yes stop_codon:yes gene_type:complete
MKIYKEVVIDMNPESSTYEKHLSEDSHEYNGKIALCCGSGKKQHNPYDWARSQPGSTSPMETSSYGIAGFPSEFAGQKFMGVDPHYKNPTGQMSDYSSSWEEEEAEDIYKYGGGGAPSWARGWYDPAFESAVRAPLQSYLGMSGEGLGEAQSIVRPDVSELTTLTEAFGGEVPEFIQEAGSMPELGVGTAAAGYGEPVLHSGVKSDIAEATTDIGFREQEYQDTLDALDLEEEDVGEERKAGLLEQRVARTQALSGRVPEYEEARASTAATGMAYSAPAERTEKSLKEENIAELSDIKRDQFDVEETYEERLEDIESERAITEGTFKEEKAGYIGDLGTAFEKSSGLMQEFSQAGTNILDAWSSMGSILNPEKDTRGRIMGQTRYGDGYKGSGSGFFEEQHLSDVAPEFNILGQITGEAGGLTNWLQDISSSAMTGLLDEETGG